MLDSALLGKPVLKRRLLPVEDLPHFSDGAAEVTVDTIECYIKKLLRRLKKEKLVAKVLLPSLLEFSALFKRSELVVMLAFSDLMRQGYQFEIYGLDSPIQFNEIDKHHCAKILEETPNPVPQSDVPAWEAELFSLAY